MVGFQEYLELFEQCVILRGLEQGRFDRTTTVSSKDGKLNGSRFGQLMGTAIQTDQILLLDYYGYLKKSEGLCELIRSVRKEQPGKQFKVPDVPVVVFASIRPELVISLAPDLVEQFPHFKKFILDNRGFDHRYRVGG